MSMMAALEMVSMHSLKRYCTMYQKRICLLHQGQSRNTLSVLCYMSGSRVCPVFCYRIFCIFFKISSKNYCEHKGVVQFRKTFIAYYIGELGVNNKVFFFFLFSISWPDWRTFTKSISRSGGPDMSCIAPLHHNEPLFMPVLSMA